MEDITKIEIVDTPEQLQESMENDAQQEAYADQDDQQYEESDYVDPDAYSSEDEYDEDVVDSDEEYDEGEYEEEYVDSDQDSEEEYYDDPEGQYEDSEEEYYEEPEYDEGDIEDAVLNYLSERLGRDIYDLEELSEPQQGAFDERVEAIARFVEETGRDPQDWFSYQRLDTSEMDDITAIRIDMATEYPDLTADEINTLIGSKYKLDPDVHSEEEIRLSQLQMKIDANDAKNAIETMREEYMAPEYDQADFEDGVESIIDDEWIEDMVEEVDAMTGLEFEVGNGRSFTFGLDEDYKEYLMEANARLDEYFDPYVRGDGSWDIDLLSSHRAVIDNIDNIVSSAYRQGMSDGQRGVVNKAANVQAQPPQIGQQNQNADPIIDQLKTIMGDGGRMTFKL